LPCRLPEVINSDNLSLSLYNYDMEESPMMALGPLLRPMARQTAKTVKLAGGLLTIVFGPGRQRNLVAADRMIGDLTKKAPLVATVVGWLKPRLPV